MTKDTVDNWLKQLTSYKSLTKVIHVKFPSKQHGTCTLYIPTGFQGTNRLDQKIKNKLQLMIDHEFGTIEPPNLIG